MSRPTCRWARIGTPVPIWNARGARVCAYRRSGRVRTQARPQMTKLTSRNFPTPPYIQRVQPASGYSPTALSPPFRSAKRYCTQREHASHT